MIQMVKGWHNEFERHSLARQGIKTAVEKIPSKKYYVPKSVFGEHKSEGLTAMYNNHKKESEKKLIQRCYEAGMRNSWASGKADEEDGNYIVENDRLNPKSVYMKHSESELKKALGVGNQTLGTGYIYKNLFFLQQIDGGDEWAVYKIKPDSVKQFESVTMGRIIKDGEFKDYLKKLQSDTYWKD